MRFLAPSRPRHPEEFEYWYYQRRQLEAQQEFIQDRARSRLVGRAYARGLESLDRMNTAYLMCWVGFDLNDYYDFRAEGNVESPLLP